MRSLFRFLVISFSISVFASFNSITLAEVKGSISSYSWFNRGEFIIEGNDQQAHNNWYINQPTDSIMLGANTYFFEVKYNERISADFTLNSGLIKDEQQVTYMVHNQQGYLKDLSYSSVEGRSSFGSCGLFYRLMGKTNKSISRFDIGVGYIGYKSSVTYNNTSVVIDWDNPLNNNRTFSEDWEKYNIYYHGIDFRIKEEVFVTQGISVSLSGGYASRLTAKYTSVKYPERPVAQQQKNIISANGNGIHYDIRLNYYFTPNFSVNGGYKYLLLRTEGHNHTDVYPMRNGSDQKLKSEMGGFIFSVAYHF
ncbi:MAG: hypothetical protein V1871_08945 [Planctomycetota bacterium]